MFDHRAFLRAKFEPRTDDVDASALAAWFTAGEAPVLKVRGLTGQEFARVREAAEKHKNIEEFISSIVGGSSKEKIAAMLAMAGICNEIPEDFAKRIEMLDIGCVSPKLDRETILRLATVLPVEFYEATNKITILTGLGQVPPGKPEPSTGMAGFERP